MKSTGERSSGERPTQGEKKKRERRRRDDSPRKGNPRNSKEKRALSDESEKSSEMVSLPKELLSFLIGKKKNIAEKGKEEEKASHRATENSFFEKVEKGKRKKISSSPSKRRKSSVAGPAKLN